MGARRPPPGPSPYWPRERAVIDEVRWILHHAPGGTVYVAAWLKTTPKRLTDILRLAGRTDLTRRMHDLSHLSTDGWNCGIPSCSQCGDPAKARRARRKTVAA